MLNSTYSDIDVIWTTTRICGYDCPCCCVNAQHVYRRGESIMIKCPASGEVETIDFRRSAGDAFSQAARHLQNTGRELDWAGKMRVLDCLQACRAKVDITGGDCLLDPSTLDLVREASRRLGKNNVTLTATGMGRCTPSELVAHVGEVNITIDQPLAASGQGTRPDGYATANIRWASECVTAGLRVRAECPLTTFNCDGTSIELLYNELREAGIQTLLLMRLFTVGRGTRDPGSVPTPAQYTDAIAVARHLEKTMPGPRVKVQCALRSLEHPAAPTNHCDAVRRSLGIMADGTVLASPWALDVYGAPLSDEWILGNVASQPLSEILGSAKAKAFLDRCDDNMHHCKVCAFQSSRLPTAADRIFDRADKLVAGGAVTKGREGIAA